MLFDTTNTDKRITQQINEAVGAPFSFKNRLKMGGIGSKRMVIQAISAAYRQYLKASHYETKANIELRPKGIIIHFRHKLESYSWVMPYHELTIQLSESLKLEANQHYISFHKELDHAFIHKLQSRFDTFQTA